MAADGTYTDEEVRAIIDHALRIQHGRDFDHAQLLAVASEVGISRDDLERAVREVEVAREGEQAKQRILERRRSRFYSHLFTFLIVNLFLFAINFLTTPGEWWVLFSVMGWGLGVLFHARGALSKHTSERALRREKKRMQAERPALRDAKRATNQPRAESSTSLGLGAAEFSAAVQDGVGQILTRVAAELRTRTNTPARVRVEDRPANTSAAEPTRGAPAVRTPNVAETGASELDESDEDALRQRTSR